MDFNFYMPVRVLGGRNAVTQHPEVFTQFGKKCLVVTGGSSAKNTFPSMCTAARTANMASHKKEPVRRLALL